MLAFDIAGLSKPLRLAGVAKKAVKLVETMRGLGKTMDAVTLSRADYFGILETVNKGRTGDVLAYTALCVGDVSVKPTGGLS